MITCGCAPGAPCPIAERIARVSLPGPDVRYRLRKHIEARTVLSSTEKRLARLERQRIASGARYHRLRREAGKASKKRAP